MNYALRNTLFLIISLVILAGGGSVYIYWRFIAPLDEMQEQVSDLQTNREVFTEKALLYDRLDKNIREQRALLDAHPKQLFPWANTSRLFAYVSRLNTGQAFTDLNYSVLDSTIHESHGTIRFSMTGQAAYRNLWNFIYRVEHSTPLLKISSIRLQNNNAPGQLHQVQFDLQLQAGYSRGQLGSEKVFADANQVLATVPSPGDIGYNPWYPHIHDLPANLQALVETDRSQLLALTSSQAVIRAQDGTIRRLSQGDAVYLGRVQHIDMTNQTVTFRLNRGGIVETVVLNLATHP